MFRKKRGGGPSLPNTDTAGPSNVINTEDNLSGLEDLIHGTNEHGIPFILVDAVECTTRSDLDKALKKIEKKRMEAVLQLIDGRKPPMLENTEEPPELNMTINLSEEAAAELTAAEEERQFLKDMSDLTFWKPEEKKEDIFTNPAASSHNTTELRTKPKMALHAGRQLDIKSDLKQVRPKLEKLQPNPESAAVPTSTLPVRPGIQRQGTFEIKRKKEDKNLGSEITTKGAASSQQTQSPKPSGPIAEGMKRTEKPPYNPNESSRTQQIINQVGDLLMELSTRSQLGNNKVSTEGASYSYMVTISPANGASNCIIQAVNGVKSPIIKDIEQPHSQPVPGQQIRSQNPKINIYAPPNRPRPEASINPTVRNSHGPGAPFIQASPVKFFDQRSKSQPLAKMPCSFLKVPAPVNYRNGRMRD